MLQNFQRILQVSELRTKIAFTLLMLVVCRIGVFIPVPGINGEVAVGMIKQATGGAQNLFQLFDIFSGGAFSQMTVIALSVTPYITASIILQLLVVSWPSLQREMRENSAQARRKINNYTRIFTILLACMQSWVYARYALNLNLQKPGIIAGELLDIQLWGLPWLFYLITIVSMTTGTAFLMWVGEQITEKGIGNGISLIISLGILSQLPSAVGLVIRQLNLTSQEPGQMSFAYIVVLLAVFISVIVGTILIIQGHRRVPLQYARRVVGRKEVQGGSSYIPLKVNYAGVIPVIFASSFFMFLGSLAAFMGTGGWLSDLAAWLSPGSTAYQLLFLFLIFFFTYYWTSIQFRPDQIASDMKKSGAFIPGIKQGKATQDYLEEAMGKITLLGAVSLALIAILPTLIGNFLGVSPTISYFFGGTALLILVGVVLETMKQVESHLLMKRYDGFMKRGRSYGR